MSDERALTNVGYFSTLRVSVLVIADHNSDVQLMQIVGCQVGKISVGVHTLTNTLVRCRRQCSCNKQLYRCRPTISFKASLDDSWSRKHASESVAALFRKIMLFPHPKTVWRLNNVAKFWHQSLKRVVFHWFVRYSFWQRKLVDRCAKKSCDILRTAVKDKVRKCVVLSHRKAQIFGKLDAYTRE